MNIVRVLSLLSMPCRAAIVGAHLQPLRLLLGCMLVMDRWHARVTHGGKGRKRRGAIRMRLKRLRLLHRLLEWWWLLLLLWQPPPDGQGLHAKAHLQLHR